MPVDQFIPLKIEDLERSEQWRISLEQFLRHFKFLEHSDGSVSAVHRSGAGVRFSAEGDIHLEPQRYLFHGPNGNVEAVDELNLQRAEAGVPQVLEAIANGNLRHLQERALARGITLPPG